MTAAFLPWRHPATATALVAPEEMFSYAVCEDLVVTAANHLANLGFRPGDRLGMYLPNSPDYALLLLACFQAGIIAMPVSTRQPRGQVPGLLEQAGCQAVVVKTAGPGWEAMRQVAVSEVISRRNAPRPPLEKRGGWEGEQGATIIFTSGSSGQPKGVLHTIGNHWYSALGANANMPFGPGERWLVSLPLYHVGGLAILWRALAGGGAVAFPDPARSLAENVRQLGITHLSLVPTQLYRLLQEPESLPSLARLKAILLGGSAITPALVQKALAAGLPIHTSYGCTEMASQVTATAPGDSLAHLLTSGKPLPYRQVKIAPDGEILVRGETLFQGYATGDTLIRPDSWFATGDLGCLAPDGYLAVTGRKDNRFVSGGENIQPEAIELALGQCAGVRQAIVVPVPDTEFGQRPVAFVDGAATPAELRRCLEKLLPRYQIPDAFLPWPEGVALGIKADRRHLQQLSLILTKK